MTRARANRTRERAIGEARTHQPHRQFRRDPTPIATLALPIDDDVDQVARMVAARVKANRHAASCGSFVLAHPDGRVFVLIEQAATTPRLIETSGAYLVGLYAADHRNGRRGACPTADRIAEDLREHFAEP